MVRTAYCTPRQVTNRRPMQHHRRFGMAVAAAAAGLMAVSSGMPTRAAAAPLASAGGPDGRVSPLARELQRTVDQLHFQQVLDLAPPGSAASAALPAGA